MEKKIRKDYEGFYIEPYELPTFDKVTKDVSNIELTKLFSSSSATLYAKYSLTKYYDVIKKGLKEGIPNASGSVSKGLVGDAIAYLNNRDAKDISVSQSYFEYFCSSAYIIPVLKDYFSFYLGSIPNNFENSDTQSSVIEYLTKLNSSGYVAKLQEVLKAVIIQQNPFLSIDKINEIVIAGRMSNSSELATLDKENKNATKTNRISPLLIGILILIGLVLIKKIKKA